MSSSDGHKYAIYICSPFPISICIRICLPIISSPFSFVFRNISLDISPSPLIKYVLLVIAIISLPYTTKLIIPPLDWRKHSLPAQPHPVCDERFCHSHWNSCMAKGIAIVDSLYNAFCHTISTSRSLSHYIEGLLSV